MCRDELARRSRYFYVRIFRSYSDVLDVLLLAADFEAIILY